MENKRRGRLEVIFNILSIIKESKNAIKITPLIRKSNLSSERFREYFNELLGKEFIREIESSDGKLITLADKGFRYLEEYRNMLSFIEDFGLG